MNLYKPTDLLLPLTGALSVSYLQASNGWWLNSESGVALTIAVLFLLATFVGSRTTRLTYVRAAELWAGSMTGLAASLFWLGPGTIWPIVLVVSSVITGCAVIAGVGVGRYTRYGGAND